MSERSVAVVHEEDVPLISIPGAIRADELVDGVPAFLVRRRGIRAGRRLGNDLAPEESLQVVTDRTGNHPGGDIKVGLAIVVKVPRGTRPSPSRLFYTRVSTTLHKVAVALIVVQGVPFGVPAVERTHGLRSSLHEGILHADARASRLPHVADIEVLIPIVVVIKPGAAHPRPNVGHAGFLGHISKSPVAVIPVEIFPAEIVHHVKVRPTVVVVVAPTTVETEAVVVLGETGFGRHVAEGPIPVTTEEEVGRTVPGIVVGRRIPVLIHSLVVAVQAEIDVEPSVAVVVGQGDSGKGPLRWLGKAERLRLMLKRPVPKVPKEQRAARPYHDQVLVTVVINIGERGAGSVVENAHACRLGNVFKSPVSTVSVQPIGKAGGLANINFVEPIVVSVSASDTIIPVNVNSTSPVQHSSPVVRPAQHLLGV